MGIEIERKFCLDSSQLLHRLLEEGLRPTQKELQQVYTHISPTQTKRYRYDGSKVIKTIKKGSGLVREEIEEEVDWKDFQEATQNSVGNIIEKNATLLISKDTKLAWIALVGLLMVWCF